jgi:hypothetical protein
MNILIESFFIGFYLLVVFAFLSLFIHDFYFTLFIAGFTKHFLGYYLGIQNAYCRKACGNKTQIPRKMQPLIFWSILEAINFAILGYVLRPYIENTALLVFICGVLMHFISEIVGTHQDFCENSCKQ